MAEVVIVCPPVCYGPSPMLNVIEDRCGREECGQRVWRFAGMLLDMEKTLLCWDCAFEADPVLGLALAPHIYGEAAP